MGLADPGIHSQQVWIASSLQNGRTMHRKLFVLLIPAAVIAVSVLLDGCGAYGPIWNCRTGCVEPGYIRDILCECHPAGSVTTPADGNPPGEPYLSRQTISGECTSFQEEDYIVNPQLRDVDVLVGFKVPPDGTWDEVWYTVSSSGSYDLGRKYSSPNCFDRDFFIKTWRYHQEGTAFLAGAHISMPIIGPGSSYEAVEQSLDPISQERTRSLRSLFQNHFDAFALTLASRGTSRSTSAAPSIRTETRRVVRLDCARVCRDALDFRCFASTPPDRSKIIGLRDRILAMRPNSRLPTEDLLRIFGLNSDPCSRSSTSVDASGHVQNDGQICAYPILLQRTDTNPVAALHIGRNVNGESIAGAGGVSVMFNRPMALPTLLFSQSALQGDYGGKVLEMSADQDGVYMNTSAGMCVALRVTP
jgi:hypothetical protein